MWDPTDRAGTSNDCAKPAESWIFISGDSSIICDIDIDSRGSSVALVESSVPKDINYRLITPPACPVTIPAPPGPRGASRVGLPAKRKVCFEKINFFFPNFIESRLMYSPVQVAITIRPDLIFIYTYCRLSSESVTTQILQAGFSKFTPISNQCGDGSGASGYAAHTYHSG